MLIDLERLAEFIIRSFLHVWPYLLLSIPIAVAVRMSGAARHIHQAFEGRPVLAILLAVAVGAFSPFCSCGVIPVVASLLVGGVPLGPVMAFWIASPSMDPEIFLLSVGVLGWKLAIWRLSATLALSMVAGFVTHLAERSGWLGENYLRLGPEARPVRMFSRRLRDLWREVDGTVGGLLAGHRAEARTMVLACCGPTGQSVGADLSVLGNEPPSDGISTRDEPACESSSCQSVASGFRDRLLRETVAASWMVGKFMALAFVLGALVEIYVPSVWVTALLGAQNPLAIPTAALLGVPIYTGNLAALPLVGGLLEQGMAPGAALAFLIAGPTTTLPAMAAVWGLVSRRVFALYVGFALTGALAAGVLFALTAS